ETPYLLARSGSRVRGVLPLVHVRSPIFGRSLVSTGFAVYGGILADNAQIATKLASEAAALGRRLGVDHVELRSGEPALEDWTPKSGLYATFVRELPRDEQDNLKAIPRKKRADVRKSLKNGLEVVRSDEPDLFW